MLCHGRATTLADVPGAHGPTTIRCEPAGEAAADTASTTAGEAAGDSVPGTSATAARDDRAVPADCLTAQFVVDPWPFAAPAVVVGCEARRLEGSFAGDAALRAALAEAPWVPLRWQLSPG